MYHGHAMKTTFGKRIRKLRESKGLSITQVAAKTGMNSSYLSKIESGDRSAPSLEYTIRLAKVLEADVGELLRLAGYSHEVLDAVGGTSIDQLIMEAEMREQKRQQVMQQTIEEQVKFARGFIVQELGRRAAEIAKYMASEADVKKDSQGHVIWAKFAVDIPGLATFYALYEPHGDDKVQWCISLIDYSNRDKIRIADPLSHTMTEQEKSELIGDFLLRRKKEFPLPIKVQKGTNVVPCGYGDCDGEVHLNITEAADTLSEDTSVASVIDLAQDIWDFPCAKCKRKNRVQFE